VTSPTTGDRVRLTTLRGVAAPAMKARLGQVGLVRRVTRRDGHPVLEVQFGETFGDCDVLVLAPGEWEPVQPPAQPTTEGPTMPDFTSAVQARLDQLASQDAALAEQQRGLQAQREVLGRERRALEAATAAYHRVRDGVGTTTTTSGRPSSRVPAHERVVPVLRGLAAGSGGQVTRGMAAAALVEAGTYGSQRSAESAVDVAVGRASHLFEKVGKGVYRLRPELVAS